MIDLFISHNKAEKEWVRELVGELKKRGVTYFFDEESIGIGEDVIDAIGKGLENSRHVALIISPASVKSRWVELEWASALHEDADASKGKLLPILKSDCQIPYLLRRLNHIDARNLDPAAVAERLVTQIRTETGSELNAETHHPKARWPTGLRPVSPYSKRYVKRDADARAKQIILDGGSAVLYGPRQIGKTSLLGQMSADLTLIGKLSVFVDVTAVLKYRDSTAIWKYIAHRIAGAFGMRWKPDATLPLDAELYVLINTICMERPLVLLLDEADVLARSSDGAALGVLRSLINDPAMKGRLSIVCAAWQPHAFFEPDLAMSPWWNPFEFVRIRAFSIQEVQKFGNQVGIVLGESELHEAYSLTAGHPRMVETLFRAIDQGHTIQEIQRNPLEPDFNLAIHALHAHRVAKAILGSNFRPTMQALMNRKQISSPKTREMLWFAGATRDIEDNPPVCSDVFRLLLGKRKVKMGALKNRSTRRKSKGNAMRSNSRSY